MTRASMETIPEIIPDGRPRILAHKRGAAAPLVLSSLAFFLLAVALLLTVVDYCCFDLSFFQREYAADGTAKKVGMSDPDLMNATETLLDYLKGERDDILVTAEIKGTERQVFDNRETAHMVDVKALYQGALVVRNVLLAGAVLLLVACVVLARGRIRKTLRKGFLVGIVAMLVVIALILVYALLDFTSFWNHFHLLLFDNDLWLLDPRVSIMINMFPATFFSDLVMRVILWTVICLGAIALILFFPYRNNGNQKRER